MRCLLINPIVRIAVVLSGLFAGEVYATDLSPYKEAEEYWESAKPYGEKFKKAVSPVISLSHDIIVPLNVGDHFSAISKDMRLKILGFLENTDQKRLTLVSRRFYQDWKLLQAQELDLFLKQGLKDSLVHFCGTEEVMYQLWKTGEIARHIPVVPVDFSILAQPSDEYKPARRTFTDLVEHYLNHLSRFPELTKLMIAESFELDPAVDMHRVMLMSAVVERLEADSDMASQLINILLDYQDNAYTKRSNGQYPDWDAAAQTEFANRDENSFLFKASGELIEQLQEVSVLKRLFMSSKLLALSGDRRGTILLNVFARSIFWSSTELGESFTGNPHQPNWVCYTDQIDSIKSTSLMIRDIQVAGILGQPGLQIALNFRSYISTLFPKRNDLHLAHVNYAARQYLLCLGRFEEALKSERLVIDSIMMSNYAEVTGALLALVSGEKLDLILNRDPIVWGNYQDLMTSLDQGGLDEMHAAAISIQNDENEDQEVKELLELNPKRVLGVINRYRANAILVFNDEARMNRVEQYIQSVEDLLPTGQDELCFVTYFKSAENLYDKELQYVARSRNNALRAAHAIAEDRFEDACSFMENGAVVTHALLISLKRQVGKSEFPEKLKSLVHNLLVKHLEMELAEDKLLNSKIIHDPAVHWFYSLVFTDDFSNYYMKGSTEVLRPLAEAPLYRVKRASIMMLQELQLAWYRGAGF